MGLKILVGSMTSTAEITAEEVKRVLEEEGWSVEILLMDFAGPEAFDGHHLYLICTSTYGQGDVPDNARDFIDSLREEQPDLSNIRYGLIALGDRAYADTYCNGGRQFDALLSELGAERLGEPLYHDASGGTMPEDDAAEWAREWADSVPGTLASAA